MTDKLKLLMGEKREVIKVSRSGMRVVELDAFYLSGYLADYAFNVLLSCADVRRIMKHQMQHKIKDT